MHARAQYQARKGSCPSPANTNVAQNVNRSFLTYPFLRIRNAVHSLAPAASETVESIRQAMLFKRVIRQHGFQLPLPAFVKRSVLKRNLLDYGLDTLVETGTQYGDTPWLFRDELSEIWSIELSAELAELARRRFRKYPHIHVVQGDSSDRLPEIIPQLKTPTLFWLDGHYSSGVTARGILDCPIYAELRAVFSICRQRWVVMIDDARSFGAEKDYPALEELENFVRGALPEAGFTVEHDMIKIVPPPA
jgi:hypothetical protein